MRMVLAVVVGFLLATGMTQKPAPAPPVYVDVRTVAEHAEAHVKGAILLPVEELEVRWRELERYRERDVVLYCRTGRRAGVALEFLKRQGFVRITNGGGLADLERSGVPVIRR